MLAEDGTGSVRGNVRKRRMIKKQDAMWISLLLLHADGSTKGDPEMINVGTRIHWKKIHVELQL